MHADTVHPDDRPAEESPPAVTPPEGKALTSDDRLIAMLCYLSQLVVPLVIPAVVLLSQSTKGRPYQRYHAVQSVALTLAIFGAFVVISIGTLVWQVVPLLGALVGLVVLCLLPLAAVGVVALYLVYSIEAYNGKWFTVPVITPFLEQQGWLPPHPVPAASREGES